MLLKKVNIRRYGKKAYVQLENNRWLRRDGIVALVDLDKSTISRVTKNFLRCREKEGTVMISSMGLPKSFIVYDDGMREQVHLSVFLPESLKKRIS